MFLWPDNSQYYGQWVNGKQHGKGTYTDKLGKAREGKWENGKKLEWLDQEE